MAAATDLPCGVQSANLLSMMICSLRCPGATPNAGEFHENSLEGPVWSLRRQHLFLGNPFLIGQKSGLSPAKPAARWKIDLDLLVQVDGRAGVMEH